MKVLTYPSSALRKNLLNEQCKIEREELTNDIVLPKLIECMIDTMYMSKALGLAANQVGEYYPLFVMDVFGDPHVFINPTINVLGPVIECDEACLSLPGVYSKMERYKNVRIIYMNESWSLRSDMFTGLQAQTIQHEMDHLSGKLYWDRLSHLKKDMLKRRYEKIHKR